MSQETLPQQETPEATSGLARTVLFILITSPDPDKPQIRTGDQRIGPRNASVVIGIPIISGNPIRIALGNPGNGATHETLLRYAAPGSEYRPVYATLESKHAEHGVGEPGTTRILRIRVLDEEEETPNNPHRLVSPEIEKFLMKKLQVQQVVFEPDDREKIMARLRPFYQREGD